MDGSRETQEKNLEASFDSLEFWEQIKIVSTTQFKDIQLDINAKLSNIENTITNRLDKIEENVSSRLETITDTLSLLNNLKKTFSDEVVNLNNLHQILNEFKSTNIVINNPTYDDLISQLREILLSEAKSDGERFNKYIDNKNNLLNELIAGRVSDLELIAKKTIESTNEIVQNFNNFSESMKKGNSSVLASETIVGKLLYSLRFVEKLPESVQAKLLNFSENEFKSLSKYIEESLVDKPTLSPQKDKDETGNEDFISLMIGGSSK